MKRKSKLARKSEKAFEKKETQRGCIFGNAQFRGCCTVRRVYYFVFFGAFGLIDVNWRMSADFDALLGKTDHWAACHGSGGLFPSPCTSARLVHISANRSCRAYRKYGTGLHASPVFSPKFTRKPKRQKPKKKSKQKPKSFFWSQRNNWHQFMEDSQDVNRLIERKLEEQILFELEQVSVILGLYFDSFFSIFYICIYLFLF